ncbi:MAG: UDP-N-acetylmuramoyl-tripeptide--D-alanyl-D-alanine ligase [bacterium]|nr:UDP-N-acetylmuramoyl-tripeptide--D-alanyl-D-alanine ligase [bacterium]
MSLTFAELPAMIKCRLEPAVLKGKLGTSNFDSRLLQPGQVFWALYGEKSDGHQFVGEAFQRGAQAAVVTEKGFRQWQEKLPDAAFVVVEDPLKALQDLARVYRSRFSLPVIALTGSNGKTATKELLAAALGLRYRIVRSEGNFNNHIGVPLTLLQIDDKTEIVLTEMGTNHPGDIELLCHIAAPTAGLVLNVGPAHLEGFGDEETVAVEKSALLRSLPANGVAFISCDDFHVRRMSSTAQTCICYGFSQGTASFSCTQRVKAEYLGLTHDAKGRFRLKGVDFILNWYGQHQVHNALSAAMVADYFQIPLIEIAETFASLPPLKGRLQLDTIAGVTLIDDCYNANPASTAAALDFLSSLSVPGRKLVVLGDHLELGKASAELHRSIGRMVVDRHLDGAFMVGRKMCFARDEIPALILHYQPDYTELDDLIAKVISHIKPGDALLVKASRGVGLDRLITALKTKLREVKG